MKIDRWAYALDGYCVCERMEILAIFPVQVTDMSHCARYLEDVVFAVGYINVTLRICC